MYHIKPEYKLHAAQLKADAIIDEINNAPHYFTQEQIDALETELAETFAEIKKAEAAVLEYERQGKMHKVKKGGNASLQVGAYKITVKYDHQANNATISINDEIVEVVDNPDREDVALEYMTKTEAELAQMAKTL